MAHARARERTGKKRGRKTGIERRVKRGRGERPRAEIGEGRRAAVACAPAYARSGSAAKVRHANVNRKVWHGTQAPCRHAAAPCLRQATGCDASSPIGSVLAGYRRLCRRRLPRRTMTVGVVRLSTRQQVVGESRASLRKRRCAFRAGRAWVGARACGKGAPCASPFALLMRD